MSACSEREPDDAIWEFCRNIDDNRQSTSKSTWLNMHKEGFLISVEGFVARCNMIMSEIFIDLATEGPTFCYNHYFQFRFSKYSRP